MIHLDNINQQLRFWVIQGIFSPFIYYIQEFSNYSIEISIEDMNKEYEGRTLLGRITNEGYFDIKNKNLIPTADLKNYSSGTIMPTPLTQDYKEIFDYTKELENNFLEIGILLSLKVNEVFWLLLKSQSHFDLFISSLQQFLHDRESDCYIYFTSSTELKELDELYKPDIFGFDCDEIDTYLDFSANILVTHSKKSEELLNDFKRVIQSDQIGISLDLWSPKLNNELSDYEKKFNNNEINQWLVIQYSSLIEKFILYTFKNIDNLINESLNNRIKNEYHSIFENLEDLKEEYSKKQFFTVKSRFDYLNLLFDICAKISSEDEIDVLEKKLSEIKTLSNLGFYRNQSSHGIDIPREKQAYAIKGYRFILELLVEYFQFVKKILSESK